LPAFQTAVDLTGRSGFSTRLLFCETLDATTVSVSSGSSSCIGTVIA
jgi:hypothetical protein